MKATVKAERLGIAVYSELNKFATFPGEWASNFFVDNKGELVRKNHDNKFYVDSAENIEWISGAHHEKLTAQELDECIDAINREAQKKGWKIVWPDQ